MPNEVRWPKGKATYLWTFVTWKTTKIAHFIEKRHHARAKIKIDYSPPFPLFGGRVFHIDINFHEQSAKRVCRPQGPKATDAFMPRRHWKITIYCIYFIHLHEFSEFSCNFAGDSLAHIVGVGQDILRKDVYERYLLPVESRKFNYFRKIRQRKRPLRAFITPSLWSWGLTLSSEQTCHFERSEKSNSIGDGRL